jgi:hypothetical protein
MVRVIPSTNRVQRKSQPSLRTLRKRPKIS